MSSDRTYKAIEESRKDISLIKTDIAVMKTQLVGYNARLSDYLGSSKELLQKISTIVDKLDTVENFTKINKKSINDVKNYIPKVNRIDNIILADDNGDSMVKRIKFIDARMNYEKLVVGILGFLGVTNLLIIAKLILDNVI